ncbi:proton-coupled amino acid transporter-like protein CG1139 [Thrips palmi]|uniref:Proton-coupled amino acid transporter-like protein CG1139 n=1 Tax=Thrips palmi TaxID=161013 RepID=A0A6P9AA78_THRPL|nr:proton-coupled amino acid transporter-like protein CG1139 [Thrips palmi]
MADEYDPYSARSGHAMTNNLETLIHLVKSSLGTGILAMPKAYSHVGLAEGMVLVYVMGAFCVYGLHILVGHWYVVEFFLLTYQLGIGCIYVAFAAKNLASVVVGDDRGDGKLDVAFMAGVTAVLLLLTQIRSLKVLAPVSLAANLSMLFGQVLIATYLLRDLPPVASRPLYGPARGLPPFAGIVLFAMESLGVIISLENNMADPAAFTGLCGILNAGMAVVITLYAVVGFLGFYRYGAEVADVITLNMPDDWCVALDSRSARFRGGRAVKVVYAAAIVLTYPLQVWPVLEITWEKYAARWLSDSQGDGEGRGRWNWLWETMYRSLLVLLTFLIAITLPNLDFIISLLGVFCLSMLGITFPALMEMCTYYEKGYGKLKWTLFKDIIIASIGIFVLIVGLWTSVVDLLAADGQ